MLPYEHVLQGRTAEPLTLIILVVICIAYPVVYSERALDDVQRRWREKQDNLVEKTKEYSKTQVRANSEARESQWRNALQARDESIRSLGRRFKDEQASLKQELARCRTEIVQLHEQLRTKKDAEDGETPGPTVSESYNKLIDEHAALKSREAALREEVAALVLKMQETEEAGKQVLGERKQTIETLESRICDDSDDTQASQAEVKYLTDQLQLERAALEAVRMEKAELQGVLAGETLQSHELLERLEQAREQREDVERSLDAYKQEVAALNRESRTRFAEMESLKSVRADLESQNDKLLVTCDHLRARCERSDNAREERDSFQQVVTTLQQKASTLTERVADLDGKLEERTREVVSLRGVNRQLVQRCRQLLSVQEALNQAREERALQSPPPPYWR